MVWFTASSTHQMFVLIVISFCQALYASCPPGWRKWNQTCYIPLGGMMNWFEASAACNRPGISSLIVPNSREENAFIWKSFAKEVNGHWIGCTDAAKENVWLCDGQPAPYTNWDHRYPGIHDNKNCARLIKPDGTWRDDNECNNKNKFAVCEMSASAVPAYHTFTGPDGRIPQRCLLHHDIKNVTVEGLLACGWACRADPRCRSFNLCQSSKRGEQMCQLNDAARLGVNSVDFKAIDNCYYFDL